MGWKKFLKPTIWKIIFTIVFSVLFAYSWLNSLAIFCPDSLEDCSGKVKEVRNIVFTISFILVILWYLLSCLIIFIYGKIKNRNQAKR